MRAARFLLAVVPLVFGALVKLGATQADDLGSPSQEVRDAAARIVRETYRPPPREPWDKVVADLHIGDRKEQILEQLAAYHPRPVMSVGGGGAYFEHYQLDDLWMLRCDYTQKDDRLFSRELSRFPRSVWVEPPKGFTGAWVTYHANGQKDHERQYARGVVVGDDVSYDEAGRRWMVQHYDPDDNKHIEETGYYPSGRVSRHGEYRGHIIGRWTWYDEDGSIKTERTYDEDGLSGTVTEYNKDGSVKSREVHRNGRDFKE